MKTKTKMILITVVGVSVWAVCGFAVFVGAIPTVWLAATGAFGAMSWFIGWTCYVGLVKDAVPVYMNLEAYDQMVEERKKENV